MLYNPEDNYEVEVQGDDYVILRERDIHAVAAERLKKAVPVSTCRSLPSGAVSSPTATPIAVTAEQLDLVKYDDKGLVAAVIQEEGTGQVLMVGWMNAEHPAR